MLFNTLGHHVRSDHLLKCCEEAYFLAVMVMGDESVAGESVADEGFAVCKLHVFGLDVDTVDAADDDVVHIAHFSGH
jgi:hypothetical protein